MARNKALWKGEHSEKRDADGNVLERIPVEHLPGVPARDLSPDELDALSEERRETLDGSGLYEVVSEEEAESDLRQPAAPVAPAASGRPRRGFDVAAASAAPATVKDAETITVVGPTTPSTDGGSE